MTPDGWLDWDLPITEAFGDWLKNRFVTISGGKSARLADQVDEASPTPPV
jgi:hypothetical protein